MIRRRLFANRRNDYGAFRSSGSEMRNAEREVFLFRRRLVIAGVLALAAFGALFGASSTCRCSSTTTTACSRSRTASRSCPSCPTAA
jgi:hypothetical protein